MAQKIDIYGAKRIPGDTYVKLAEYLEKEQGCAGICHECPYYLYTNCDNGRRARPCSDKVKDLING